MLVRLKAIAEKELAGTSLADDDYAYIRNIGDTAGKPDHFLAGDFRIEISSDTDKKMAVIADVHTDTNSKKVLEEAVGNPYHLFVIVPVDGVLTLTQGAAFSYYEFKQPMSDRLTDEAWQSMLAAGRAPEPPAWTKSFLG